MNLIGLRLYQDIITCNCLSLAFSLFDDIDGAMYYAIMENKKYNVTDEFNRLIESNVSLKRARKTVRLNPGSKLREVHKCKTNIGLKTGN